MPDSKRILVVDDDPDIQFSCRTVLESAGYKVEVAGTGAEGRALAAAQRPDLVLLDIMMEEADAGLVTARWFASELPGVPVLMLSSIADAADGLFDTSSLGLAGLVNKPLTPRDLLEQVAGLLARAH